MKRILSLAAAFLLGVMVTAGSQNIFATKASAQAASQKAPDAVAIDPDHHNVVMENDHARVFEVRASHGARSPMHSHPPLVLVSVGSARGKLTTPEGKSTILDLRPGQVLWLENVQHSWELLSGDLHIVAVEVKSAAKAAAAK
jgi:quercetin dioxygenase-like cupin family protein